MNDGYILEELGKVLANGVNTSQKNGALHQNQDSRTENQDGTVTGGGKDSGMEGVKKMLCLAIFSTRHKHTINLSL
ncbi:hypothetical protein [Chryseobacterium taklimakanense]|uniref:Uncharacterized protein n=1 Tax=Chryseobacterium taklimakanense TaxID=536441 RepID=A0A3G8WJS3_9FLAO|nr:hypothetical protein [Chryseobacterium taklimakanense]AZI20829.1 hypothetical protein EIH08_09040 [Chryseobacterium taklimakanense]